MRFASRENTRLGQPEVGVDCIPAGGGTERLHIWSGAVRALEIVLGANDSTADTADDTDTSTGHFQRRTGRLRRRARAPVATFDRGAIAAARISSTMSRCRPPTGSSPPSLLLRPR